VAETSPQQFGKYLLLSKIATGGMAVTYRARMTGAAGVTKPCVIKQILPHFVDDPDFVEMFIGEARLVAGMSHSNIAQVFDFGELDGQYFIAMELVQGQPLSKVLRRAQKAGMGVFPEALSLHIVSKLCDGLDYAHRHVSEDGQAMGLVHRDVSPDNVLISYEGEVKVIDFGIAKATSLVEAKTSPGTLKGKFPYFSPEQARGQQDLDARTDVYAAGVVLYEMVCGKRPYEGEFVTVLPRITSGDCLPPSAVNPSVGADLEAIISGAMAIDRDARYQSAKDLSESLVELLYRDNPRFTPALLSQLMAYLFADELAAEGRKVEVPAAFKEQLSLWQTGAMELSGRSRPPSTGGSGARPPSSGLRSKPGSDSGVKPGSEGGRRPTTSSPSLRKVPTGAPRRPTDPQLTRSEGGVRRVTAERPVLAERPAPPVPELPEEPDTDASAAPPVPTLAAPHDTPVEVPAVLTASSVRTATTGVRSGGTLRTAADEAREKLAAEEAERLASRQKGVRSLALYLFGAAAVLLLVVFIKQLATPDDALPAVVAETTTLWVTSKPPGAAVKLNDRDLPAKTPLMVDNILVGQANTLVLTLPGHLAWTRRFTPLSKLVEPITAELQPLAAPATPPTVVVVPGAATDADGGTVPDADGGTAVATTDAADGGTTAAGNTALREMHEVDYPTRLLVLRPMYNAAPIPQYTTATIDLNPSLSYSVWTQGGASVAEGRSTVSSTLVFFAEGDNVSADGSFGLLGTSMRTIKNARKLHVFALDDSGPEDNVGTVRVIVRQSAYVPPRTLTFDAKQHAVELKPEHQVVLRGLNPRSTYLFTVRDDFAELRPSANGRVRQVLCVERGPEPGSVRATHRLMETGKRYQITDAEDVRCTFPDTKVGDNQGAIEVDIVDVTGMTRKQRAQALKGSRASER